MRASRYWLIVLTLLAGGVLLGLAHRTGAAGWELAVIDAVRAPSNPGLDSAFRLVTRLGDSGLVGPVVIAGALALLWAGRSAAAAFCALAFYGAVLGNPLLKQAFDRDRPDREQALEVAGGLAFPSGHAAAAAALAAVLVVLCWHTRWRRAAIALGAVVYLSVAVSRIYLGVHYPADVIGAGLFVSAWALAVRRVTLHGMHQPSAGHNGNQ